MPDVTPRDRVVPHIRVKEATAMNADPLRDITEEDVRRYDEDGVVLLKGMFDQAWLKHAGAGTLTWHSDQMLGGGVEHAGRTLVLMFSLRCLEKLAAGHPAPVRSKNRRQIGAQLG